MGLHGYTLPDMDELAKVVDGLYHHEVRGGEGHMEVAKLLLNHLHRKVNMTLSTKPFVCMPSAGVSDGVQSAVQSAHPDALYLAVETTGDAAVNVYSRVQMVLHKAKQQAQREFDEALAASGLTLDEARARIQGNWWQRRTLFKAAHVAGATAADQVHALGKVSRLRGVVGKVVPALA